MQFLFADLVRDEARRQFGSRVRLIPVNQPTNIDKDHRIRMVLKPLEDEGRLFFLEKSPDLDTEYSGFPTAQRKDIVDALASAINLVPKRQKAVQDNDEIQQLAEYLRKSGAPARLIEERVAAVRQGR